MSIIWHSFVFLFTEIVIVFIIIDEKVYADNYNYYRGLGLQYRGLWDIYVRTNQPDKANIYLIKLSHWEAARAIKPEPADPLHFLSDENLTAELIPSLLEECVKLFPEVSSLDSCVSLLELSSLSVNWSQVSIGSSSLTPSMPIPAGLSDETLR